MKYWMKNNHTGGAAAYESTVEITEKDGLLTFFFTARHSGYYAPYKLYNENHYEGDVCEVMIGSSADRRTYYEIEVSPENGLFLAKVTNDGFDAAGAPLLTLDYVPADACFVKSAVEKTAEGYTVTVTLPKEKILCGDGPIFFNTFRIDTDGGAEMDRHLITLFPTLCPTFHVPARFDLLEEYCKAN